MVDKHTLDHQIATVELPLLELGKVGRLDRYLRRIRRNDLKSLATIEDQHPADDEAALGSVPVALTKDHRRQLGVAEPAAQPLSVSGHLDPVDCRLDLRCKP